MKDLLNIRNCCLILAVTTFFSACGGGGGGGGGSRPSPTTETDQQQSSNQNPQTQTPPPIVYVAPAHLRGSTLRLAEANNTRELRFSPTGERYDELNNGTEIASGNYQYNRSAASSATLVLQENAGPVNVTLNFSSGTSGSFSYTQGRTGGGTFTLQLPQTGGSTGGTTGSTTGTTSGTHGGTDGGTTGSTGQTTGSTDGNTTGTTGSTGSSTSGTDGTATGGSTGETTGGTSGGLAYSSLTGRTMAGTRTFTSTGPVGQTHIYTFTQSTFHDSDPPEESDGYYTYTATGDTAFLVLNYTEPEEFAGDRHDLEMTYTEPGRGTFTSTYYRQDGTTIVINGTFRFTN